MVLVEDGAGQSQDRAQVAPPTGTSQRKRKKWWPQNSHRQGWTSQWKADSMMFVTPTLLNSMDLQCGQLVEKKASVARLMRLAVGFAAAVTGWAGLSADGVRRMEGLRAAAPAPGGAAKFASGLDLFRGADVGLGQFDVFFCACDLALVPFDESLGHVSPGR